MQLSAEISEKQIGQLIKFSTTDKVVAEFTSDTTRFKDRAAYNKWLKKGRAVYVLEDKAGNLLGIAWFGKASFPNVILKPKFAKLQTEDYNTTVALRMYGEARGKGLAKEMLATAIEKYGQKGLWLEASHDNIAAIKTYQSLFTQVSDPNEKGKIVMVLKTQR